MLILMANESHLITYLKPIWLENILNVYILSISDPPGPPEISGYIEGETIRLGQTITLVCTAQGGNPLAEIIWYKNGIKVDSSYTTSGRASSNTYSFVASTEDNNARYRCESKNDLSPTPLSAEIILSVQCKYKIYIFIFFTLHSRITTK